MNRLHLVLLLLGVLLAAGPAVIRAADDSSAPNLAPELQIKIGDFGQASDFQVGYGPQSCPPEQSQSGQCLEVPWIGQYVGAVYRYGVALAAALAMLMITIGGAVWLTAGGSSERVSTAKSFIVSAISGLLLALLSYVILYTVNPRLVALEPLSVPVVSDVAEPEVGGKTAEYVGSGYHCLIGNVCGSYGLTKEACELAGGQIVGTDNYDALCDSSTSCACYEFSGSDPGKLVSCATTRRGASPARCQPSNAAKTSCYELTVSCLKVPRKMNIEVKP